MEDYTYHLDPQGPKVLGAHMLEICPSLAADKPSCEIHPLGIGGKSDPVRLVFTAPAGPAINVAMIDLGDRFRLLVNEVDAVKPEQALPKLPVARAFWKPRPDLKTAAAALDLRWWPAPYGLQSDIVDEPIEDLAEMAWSRVPANRPTNTIARNREPTAMEPTVLPHQRRVTGRATLRVRRWRLGNARLADDCRIFQRVPGSGLLGHPQSQRIVGPKRRRQGHSID